LDEKEVPVETVYLLVDLSWRNLKRFGLTVMAWSIQQFGSSKMAVC
jgi:hypothetical protein